MNNDPSLVVKEWVLNESFAKIRPFLEQQKLLRPTQHSLTVTCPESPNCLVEAQCVDGDFFAHCNCHEDVGLIPIDRSQLIQFRPDIPNFCAWIKDQLGLEGDIREVETELWFLGSFKQLSENLKGYIAWTESLDTVLRLSESIKKQNPRHFILWFGDMLHTDMVPKNIVLLWDILDVIDGCFILSDEALENRLSSSKTIDSNFTLLDSHIALEKANQEYFLHFERIKEKFKYRDKISPQAAKLIQHCFKIRNYAENAKTLETFSKSGLAKNKRTISTKIKEVNDLCKKRKQHPIFHKFENEKWGFNPELNP